MQKLYISPTSNSPEIHFSPEENIFLIRGSSSPENVRGLYYPVIKWIATFIDEILAVGSNNYSSENPFKFQVDLIYFNSSSAKFLHDIFLELKKLSSSGVTVVVEWFYKEDDIDMKEAGSEIALLAEMEFCYISKTENPE